MWIVAALAVGAIASGFLIGHPAEVGAAVTIAVAVFVSMVTTRDLSARAELRSGPVRKAADSPPLEQLRQVDETLRAARESEVAVDSELRPLFRAIAAVRLARRGVDVDRQPEEARAILGEELWELVQTERAPGSNRSAGGISAAGLQGLIGQLEQL